MVWLRDPADMVAGQILALYVSSSTGQTVTTGQAKTACYVP